MFTEKKEQGDELYSEMRDKLSIQEDLLADWSDTLHSYGFSKGPKEAKRNAKLLRN